MPKPATLQAMVKVIRASRLVTEPRLQAALACHGDADARPPAALLDQLVGDGTFTPFQAAQLARGRWRGFVVGPYRLLDRLGRGGMGQVFLAEHATTGRAVAVKVLGAEFAADPTARARFAREARAAAALDHPNIVRVFDVDADADPPFLVMEHIDGLSLQAAVARHGTFPAEWAARVGHQVALALQCAADADLVHRDVKPANVLLDRGGQCKLLDLGIALVGGAAGLTLAGDERAILGTADYLAPEQAIDSSGVDARADLYALGGTLYYLLAGAPPFPDGTTVGKLMAKQFRDPPRIDRLRPDLPDGLADVVHRLLAREPADRPATPVEAAAAFAPFAAVGPDFLVKLFSTRPGAEPAGGPRSPPTGDPETSGTLDASSGAPTDAVPLGALRTVRLPTVEPPPTPCDFDFAAESPTTIVSRAELARGFVGHAGGGAGWRHNRFAWCLGGSLATLAVVAVLAVAFRPPPGRHPPPPPPDPGPARRLADFFLGRNPPNDADFPRPPAKWSVARKLTVNSR